MDEAVGRGSAPAPVEPGGDDPDALLMRHGVDKSVGFRLWVMSVPTLIVGQFAHIEPGWPGATSVAAGPEFVYRTDGLDIVLAGMYVGYQAPAGYFRGTNEMPNATERVESELQGIFVTAHFLKGIRFARVFELQIGAGIGVGYLFGNLYRSQAYSEDRSNSASSWRDCDVPGGPGGAYADYCANNDNQHFTHPNGGAARYAEPGIFAGGAVPTIMPWVSLPHVALHFRPIQNLDIRLEGGFAIIGFYGGGAIHFVF